MLVCLVTAMTGTAAFLSWLDPTPASTSDALPYEEITRLARSAVGDDVVIRYDQWQEVEISLDSAVAARTLLSATVGGGLPAMGGSDAHFYVGRDGRPVRTGRWSDQHGLRSTPSAPAMSPHTVRIQVSRLAEEEPLSSLQWLCVRMLVAALNEAIAPDGYGLPIRLGEGWEKVYGVEHGSVFELVPLEATSG